MVVIVLDTQTSGLGRSGEPGLPQWAAHQWHPYLDYRPGRSEVAKRLRHTELHDGQELDGGHNGGQEWDDGQELHGGWKLDSGHKLDKWLGTLKAAG